MNLSWLMCCYCLLFNAKLWFQCFSVSILGLVYGFVSCCCFNHWTQKICRRSAQLSCWRTVAMTASTSSLLKCPWETPHQTYGCCFFTVSDYDLWPPCGSGKKEKIILHSIPCKAHIHPLVHYMNSLLLMSEDN